MCITWSYGMCFVPSATLCGCGGHLWLASDKLNDPWCVGVRYPVNRFTAVCSCILMFVCVTLSLNVGQMIKWLIDSHSHRVLDVLALRTRLILPACLSSPGCIRPKEKGSDEAKTQLSTKTKNTGEVVTDPSTSVPITSWISFGSLLTFLTLNT